jgi:hypothetical protein
MSGETIYSAWRTRHPDDAYPWIVGIRYETIADVVAYCETHTAAEMVRDALNAAPATKTAKA